MVKVTIPYQPRDWQLNEHLNLSRFTVLVIHRRAGKTYFAVNELIKQALNPNKDRPQVAYIAPTYRQAKQVSWEIFKEMVAPIPGVRINESELRIDFPNGGRILVLGAENPDSLRGLYLDYVVLDEVADMPSTIWGTIIRPALADREGGALFIGTPKGKNFFHQLYVRGKSEKNWKSTLLTYKDTNTLSPAEIESLRSELSEEEFEQELECSFTAAIRGAYFGKAIARAEAEGRIRRIKYDRDYPVITAWDIGFDGTAIWYIQIIDAQIRVIDFDYIIDEDVPFCTNIVKQKPYVYEFALLPHDSKKRNSDDKRKTTESQIKKAGLKTKVVKRGNLLDGINQGRRLIDKVEFSIDNCPKGLESLRQYRAKYDETKGVFQQEPVHDKHSHPADAWRTLAMGLKTDYTSSPINRASVVGNYDPFSPNYNQVIKDWDIFNRSN